MGNSILTRVNFIRALEIIVEDYLPKSRHFSLSVSYAFKSFSFIIKNNLKLLNLSFVKPNIKFDSLIWSLSHAIYIHLFKNVYYKYIKSIYFKLNISLFRDSYSCNLFSSIILLSVLLSRFICVI